MSEGGDMAPGHDPGEAVVLAFLLAGVLPGGAAPRLFYRSAGEGYADTRCATGRVMSAGPEAGVGISFELPDARFDFVLLEPAALPGRYRVLRMAFAGEALTDLAGRTMTAVEQLEPDAGTAGLVFADEDDRPALELDFRGLVRRGLDDRLELVFRRESQVPELVPRPAAGFPTGSTESAAAVARLAREVANLSDRLAELASLQEATGSRHEAVTATLSSTIAGQERALAELAEQSRTTRGCIESSAAAASSSLAKAESATAASRDATMQAIAGLHARVDALANAVENVFWRRWLRRLRGGGR